MGAKPQRDAGPVDEESTGPREGARIDTQGRTTTVITVTRLNGPQFAVNPDLIQRIETTPDTILTLIDGSKYVIAESTDEVTDRIITYRATVVARTMQFAEQDERMGDMTVAAVTQLRPSAAPPRGLSAVPEAD